jgi:hypothetical protein
VDKNTKEECYKVVYKIGDKLLSFMLGELKVVYEPQVRTIPAVGKLFVFEDLESAKDFWHCSVNSEVWLARGENLNRISIILAWSKVDNCAVDFWELYKLGVSPPYGSDAYTFSKAPAGSMVSDSVTLIERIRPR